jgi:hypothetical protein
MEELDQPGWFERGMLYYDIHRYSWEGPNRTPGFWDFRAIDNDFYANETAPTLYTVGPPPDKQWQIVQGTVHLVGMATGTPHYFTTAEMGRIEDHVIFYQFEQNDRVYEVTPDKFGHYGFLIPRKNSLGQSVTKVLVWSSGTLRKAITLGSNAAGGVGAWGADIDLIYGDLDENNLISKTVDFENGGGTGYFDKNKLGKVRMNDFGLADIYHYDTNCDLDRNGEVTVSGAGNERSLLLQYCYPNSGTISGDNWP